MRRTSLISEKVRQVMPDPSPRSLGYRMPAEWEHHEGTWFSWPHNLDTWGRHLSATEESLAKAVKALCEGEIVHINVLNDAHCGRVDRILTEAGVNKGIQFHCIPTNDAWCRDHGAIFLSHMANAGFAAIDWGYNAWGGKYPPYDLDDAVPRHMCDALDAKRFHTSFILEGGSIDVNGTGVLLTTASCLLHPSRNPGFRKEEVEWVLREMLGVDYIVWLNGELEGDDTDGHIDNIARFVKPDTVVLSEVDIGVEDLNSERLKTAFGAWRLPLETVFLPTPAPVYIDGKRMPASYLNFYIGNEVVLMPAFNDPLDDLAQHTLQSCFPIRRVIAIDCTSVIWGLGALHCLSQQVPYPIKHTKQI